MDIGKRMQRHCALPGTDTSQWTGEEIYPTRMGAPADYDREGQPDDPMTGYWAKPFEDIVNAGCPGAWYRTEFVSSVLHYYRRAVEGRQRVPNPSFDQCDDWLVREAIQELESWEEAAHSDLIDALRKNAARSRGDG